MSHLLRRRLYVPHAALYVGGGGGAPFDPSDLTLTAWWDISDLSTLWQDTAGTTAVTADGQSVARVDDKSGGGLNWLQSTSGNRPLYKTDGSLHWLLFDGVNDAMDMGAWATLLGSTPDHVVGLRTPATNWLLACSAGNNQPLVAIGENGSASAMHVGAGSPTTLVNKASIGGTTRDHIYDALAGGTNKVLTMLNLGGTPSFNQILSGHSSFPSAFRIFGWIIAPMDSTEQANAETWMGNKMGISI